MSTPTEKKFRSRKFIMTGFIAASVIGLAAFGKLDSGATSAVLLACVTAYNWANVRSQ